MNYAETLHAIDTQKALRALELPITPNGAYINFNCPDCGKTATIKAYGEKKNLIWCNTCKTGSHIIKLTMKLQGMDWEIAKKYLKEKAIPFMFKRLERPLEFEYELVYTKELEKRGFSKEFCERMGIGYPKGRTMLAGCNVFNVYHEDGQRIAYYGIRIKDKRPVFHTSFNPEHFLYNLNNIDKLEETYFTTDMWKCCEIIQQGGQAICNWGLPYLSEMHLMLLGGIKCVTYLKDENFNEIMKQVASSQSYYRFQ